MKYHFAVFVLVFLASAAGTITISESASVNTNSEEDVKSFQGYQVLRIETNSIAALEYLQQLYLSDVEVYDFWSPPSLESPVDVAVSDAQARYLNKTLATFNVQTKVLVADLADKIKKSEEDSNNRQEASMTWTAYHRLNTIYSHLETLETEHPGVVKIVEIGQSSQNRSLKLIKISAPGSSQEVKPAIWIDGGIHAREWVSPASLTYMITQFIIPAFTNRNSNNSKFLVVSNIIKSFDWFILPVANPDGYEYTWSNNRMWRKTRSSYRSRFFSSGSGSGPKSIWDNIVGYCSGVDANRNFDVHWGGKGTSGNPCSEIFRGRSVASEPEVKAVQNFVLENRQQIKLFLSIHSYSQMILLPWAYDDVEPADFSDLKTVGIKAAAAIENIHGTVYRTGQTTKLLGAAAGSSKDWAKKVAGIKYAFGFELRDRGEHGFILPADQIIPTAEEAWAGINSMVMDMAEIYKTY